MIIFDEIFVNTRGMKKDEIEKHHFIWSLDNLFGSQNFWRRNQRRRKKTAWRLLWELRRFSGRRRRRRHGPCSFERRSDPRPAIWDCDSICRRLCSFHKCCSFGRRSHLRLRLRQCFPFTLVRLIDAGTCVCVCGRTLRHVSNAVKSCLCVCFLRQLKLITVLPLT